MFAGAEALLHSERYDAVLIDWMTVCPEWLRSRFDGHPWMLGRVILTGRSDGAAGLPLCSVLPKPIEVGLLVESVARRAAD